MHVRLNHRRSLDNGHSLVKRCTILPLNKELRCGKKRIRTNYFLVNWWQPQSGHFAPLHSANKKYSLIFFTQNYYVQVTGQVTIKKEKKCKKLQVRTKKSITRRRYNFQLNNCQYKMSVYNLTTFTLVNMQILNCNHIKINDWWKC